jgi:hypothetical protein
MAEALVIATEAWAAAVQEAGIEFSKINRFAFPSRVR